MNLDLKWMKQLNLSWWEVSKSSKKNLGLASGNVLQFFNNNSPFPAANVFDNTYFARVLVIEKWNYTLYANPDLVG